LDLILQNPNFIINIRKIRLEFNINGITDGFTDFLILHFNCNSITAFYFEKNYYYDKTYYELIEKYSCQITNSQQNLKNIIFNDECMISTLSLKNSNFTGTLETLNYSL
jgi:hypothetical protein